jgi:hypothetical protein
MIYTWLSRRAALGDRYAECVLYRMCSLEYDLYLVIEASSAEELLLIAPSGAGLSVIQGHVHVAQIRHGAASFVCKDLFFFLRT